MRIGLISDTHQPSDRKSLWPEIGELFAGVDLILHAGDIVAPVVLDWLEKLAPVLAARGNNDFGWDDRRLAERQLLRIEGHSLAMLHDMPEDKPYQFVKEKYLGGEAAGVIITGHTHVEGIRFHDGVLWINPGSPTHPHLWSTRLGTVALLDIAPDRMEAHVVRLGELPGLRNPGVEWSYTAASGARARDSRVSGA